MTLAPSRSAEAETTAFAEVDDANVPDAVAPPPGNPRFPLVDGLRAIAALAILVGHTSDSAGVTNDRTLYRPLFGLTFGVTLFFVISGFLLFRPYFRAQVDARGGPRVKDYARRRALRIVPAYWVALTLLSIYPGLPGMFTGNSWKNYLLVQEYDSASTLTGLGPTWSLCIEVAFYIALPVIAFALARACTRRTPRAQITIALVSLGVLAVASIAIRSWGLATNDDIVPRQLISFFAWFAAGMMLAVLSVAAERGRTSRPVRWVTNHPGMCWLAALGVFVVMCVAVKPQYLLNPWAVGDAISYFVLVMVMSALLVVPAVFDSGRGFPRRVLSNRVVAWLGLVSYGIFLWHQGVLIALNGDVRQEGGWSFFPLLGATLALTIALAAVSYYLIEKPLLSLKNGLGPLRALRARAQARQPRTATGRITRIEAAVLALVVATCAGVGWGFASQSWFFSDDFVLFHQVQIRGIHPGLLFERAIVHFAPGHRVFEIVLQRFAPLNFDVALAILLVFHCVSIVLMQRVLTAIFGRRWWSFVVALAFGLSFLYLPALQWYSGGLLVIPGVTFSLACIHAYVLWWRTRQTPWLVWSLAALCLGLAFYEKTALVPLYLFGMTALLLAPGMRIRDAVRSVSPRVWALYAAPVVLLVVIYVAGSFADSAGKLDLGELPAYLRIAWLDGFSPSIFGVHVPAKGATAWHDVAVVAAQVLVVAIVAGSVVWRRGAWRAWAFLAAAFLLNMAMIVPRLGAFGPEIGFEPRYFTEMAMLVPLIVPFAFALPAPRAGDVSAAPPARRRVALSRPVIAVITVALMAAYAGLVLVSDTDITQASPNRAAGAWAQHLDASLHRLRATGQTPALIDDRVPPRVIPPFVVGKDQPPANLLSSVLALRGENVVYNEAARPAYRAAPNGDLQPVRFVAVAGGDLAALHRAGTLRLSGGTWTRKGTTNCVRAGSVFATLQFEPRPALQRHHFAMRAVYRTSPGALILMNTNAGVGYSKDPAPALGPAPTGASRYVLFDPLPGNVPTFAGVQLLVPANGDMCFSSLTFGYLRTA